MPKWDIDYYNSLKERFDNIKDGLDDKLEDIIKGRVAPSLDDIGIGSGRLLRAVTLFFDIRGFSNRTGSSDSNELKKTLLMLDVVIPMVMNIIYDHGGYIEKNTGDGIMAIIGAEKTDEESANDALDISTTIFFILRKLINPYLQSISIEPVNARIGIDMGTLLLSRIGLPTGTSKHQRNFLTAVGPSANISCKIQQMAGTNEIWTGDLINKNAFEYRKKHFVDKTPAGWTWVYSNDSSIPYKIWEYSAVKKEL